MREERAREGLSSSTLLAAAAVGGALLHRPGKYFSHPILSVQNPFIACVACMWKRAKANRAAAARSGQMDWIKFDVYFAFYTFQSAARFSLEWIPGPGTAGSSAPIVGSRNSFRGVGDLVTRASALLVGCVRSDSCRVMQFRKFS